MFPLLHSRDLVNWTVEGAVFTEPPAWSSGSYWAPEIAEYGGKFFVYYTARRKNGPLCVAVATAARPRGPWTDHGPLVCQDAGSIDAAPITGEDGRRYLVWKEDGNSRKLPTPLWAQPLSADGTSLTGERREILRNEAPWEGHLVEGPFILRRGDWFYLFYSAGGCCGRTCDYRLGAARSHNIGGPWERNPANPILSGNDDWKCPGHGSLVTLRDGRTFLLYHAYHPRDFEYAGRQALLDEVTWPAGMARDQRRARPERARGGAGGRAGTRRAPYRCRRILVVTAQSDMAVALGPDAAALLARWHPHHPRLRTRCRVSRRHHRWPRADFRGLRRYCAGAAAVRSCRVCRAERIWQPAERNWPVSVGWAGDPLAARERCAAHGCDGGRTGKRSGSAPGYCDRRRKV